MAKSKKPTKKLGVPFLAAAFFCESIMEESNKMLSAIHIMDSCQMWLTPQAPTDVPSVDNPVQVQQNILLIFRSGDSPGKHQLKLVIQQPNGKRSEVLNKEITLSPQPQGGVNVKTNVAMQVHSSGVYWVDVILDGKRHTRMPLDISIQRLPTPGATNS